MPIAQLIYFVVEGSVRIPYHRKQNAKYKVRSARPIESMMWKNKW